jgi:phosphoglycolate phosphatase-like HAD superfamily hydrolase
LTSGGALGVPPRSASPSVRAVVFDVGETLLDESTEYGTWADWLGVPRHTFSAMFGAVIAQGDNDRQTFHHFRPGFDLAGERLRREEADFGEHFDESDLYPDARPSLEKLKQLGFLIGAAGNQTVQAEQRLRALNLPVDFIGTSAGWGSRSHRQDSSPGSLANAAARRRRSPMLAIDSTTTSVPPSLPVWSPCSCDGVRGGMSTQPIQRWHGLTSGSRHWMTCQSA